MLLPRLANRRPALSLLEVLVALAIFLMAMTALWQLVGMATANAEQAHHRDQAARIAQSKLHLAQAGYYWQGTSPAAVGPMSADDDDQDIEDDGDLKNYTWWIVVNQQNPDDSHQFGPNVYQIEVHVKRELTGGKPPIEIVLTQFIMDPSLMATTQDGLLPLSSLNTTPGWTVPNGPPPPGTPITNNTDSSSMGAN